MLASVLLSVASASLLSGLTYSPYTVDGCLGIDRITADLGAINRAAGRIRLYGADCDQNALVLRAIRDNAWPLRVVLGIWTRGGEARFQSDLRATLDVLADPVLSRAVDSVVVGNEDLYNGVPESQVISHLNYVRTALRSAGLGHFPISTAEVFNLWTPTLAQYSDSIMASIYPFYSHVKGSNESVAQAAAGTLGQLSQIAARLATTKAVVVGETGYPRAGSAPVMFDAPTPANQCTYFDSFRCQAAAAAIDYFLLEAKDAAWKGGYSTEQHFGLMDADGALRCPLTPC